jgi:hypothetical protein
MAPDYFEAAPVMKKDSIRVSPTVIHHEDRRLGIGFPGNDVPLYIGNV